MNNAHTPGYVMMIMTFVIMITAFVVALSGGEHPTNQDVLTAVAIIGAGQTAILGYFATLLWDRLNMLSNLYAILTGDNQEEMAGTLQRFRNTIVQGARNFQNNIGAVPSSDPSLTSHEEQVDA